jgi:hypothetical protein
MTAAIASSLLIRRRMLNVFDKGPRCYLFTSAQVSHSSKTADGGWHFIAKIFVIDNSLKALK